MWEYDEWAEHLSDLSLLNQGMEKKKKKEDRYGESQGTSSLFKKSLWILTLQFNQGAITSHSSTVFYSKFRKAKLFILPMKSMRALFQGSLWSGEMNTDGDHSDVVLALPLCPSKHS